MLPLDSGVTAAAGFPVHNQPLHNNPACKFVNTAVQINAMTEVDNALKKIERWLEASQMPEARLGLLASANAGAMERIRAGTAQIATLQAVLRYIEANPVKR